MPIYTSHQARITLNVDGVKLDNKSWDKFTGGDHQSETQNYNPGGMADAVAVGGVTKRSPITLERAWDDTLIGVQVDLDRALNAPCTVGVTPLKTKTKTAGRPRTYTGVLKEVHPPDHDSTSATVSMMQVVVEANEPITG